MRERKKIKVLFSNIPPFHFCQLFLLELFRREN
jgi:hypothetical protein